MWKNLNEPNANSNTTDAADVASDLIGKDVQAALSVDLHRSLQTKLKWWWKKLTRKENERKWKYNKKEPPLRRDWALQDHNQWQSRGSKSPEHSRLVVEQNVKGIKRCQAKRCKQKKPMKNINISIWPEEYVVFTQSLYSWVPQQFNWCLCNVFQFIYISIMLRG